MNSSEIGGVCGVRVSFADFGGTAVSCSEAEFPVRERDSKRETVTKRRVIGSQGCIHHDDVGTGSHAAWLTDARAIVGGEGGSAGFGARARLALGAGVCTRRRARTGAPGR